MTDFSAAAVKSTYPPLDLSACAEREPEKQIQDNTVITNVLNPFTEYAMENSPYVEEGEKVGQETETEVPSQPWTDEEVIVLTKMLWGEAGSVPSDTEKAAVV